MTDDTPEDELDISTLSLASSGSNGEDEDAESEAIPEEDRVPIEEISEQTDVVLTSFFDSANSMETWYPRVAELDVPVPKTRLIELEGGSQAYLGMSKSELAPLLMVEDADEKMNFIGRPSIGLDGMQEAIETEFNDEDVFVRSFFKSARHGSDKASKIRASEPEGLKAMFLELFDDHIMQNIPTGDGIAIREWLDLDFRPEASRTCHPEVRFFIEDGEVNYHWPRMSKEAFVNETGDEGFYDEQVQHIEANIDELEEYAQRVAEAFTPHAWSVDFVMDTDGNWYCTDMAVDALYWNEKTGKWSNMSEHETGSEYNLEETVGTELPPPKSPPSGFPAWRDVEVERGR